MSNFLWTTPDEKYGTLAELNGSLTIIESGSNPAMQELDHTPIYPSIQFEAIQEVKPNYILEAKEPPNILVQKCNDTLDMLQQEWNKRKSAIENTPFYQQISGYYNTIYENYLKQPEFLFDHPLFSNDNTFSSIQCIAWHPHFDMLAVAHKDNLVYIYEKQPSSPFWSCQVLAHIHMKTITCLEWKSKSSGLLAVGCQSGVCIWTLDERPSDFTPPTTKQPRYHPHAFMQHINIPHVTGLTWDPTPSSHLIAIVSANSNALVIHDFLLNRTTPLKRYGKGNILLRWSPNGEFLFQGGSCGISRMWDTTDWSCQHITNPPGLWIQSACWAPDNRTLVYSMCGKSDIHALFLKGNKVDSILDVKLQSTPTTTVKTTAGKSVQVGGVIRDMSMDTRNGQRLAVCYEGSPLIALYSVKKVSQVEFDFNSMLFPIGYIRSAEVSCQENGSISSVKPMNNANPLQIKFSSAYKDGALMAVAWDNGIVTFVTHNFLSDEEVRSRFM